MKAEPPARRATSEDHCQAKRQRLSAAVAELASGNIRGAGHELDAMVPLDPADPYDLKCQLFRHAIGNGFHSRPAEAANLYLAAHEDAQIDVFNLMARRMPLVSAAARLANAWLAHFLGDLDEATLLDVGIGTGRQVVELLHQLAASPACPGRLTVIGIEPAADDGLVFEVIDRLDLSEAERHAMKARFFAREIDDVMSRDETRRTERHETAQMWLARAARAGFRPYPRNIEPLCASADTTRLIRIASHDGYTGLDFAGETMVANLALVQSGQSGAIVVALGTDCRDLCDIR